MRRRRNPIGVGAGVCAATLAACQLIAGIERVERSEPEPEPAVEAATEAAAPPDPCAHARAPARPAVDDAEQDEDQLAPFLIAMRSFEIPAPDAGAVPGFDLDGICTCDTRPFSAGDGGSSCRPAGDAPICDGDGGVDNHMSSLFDRYRTLIDINEVNLTKEIEEGRKTLVLQLADYNGRANDRLVTVGLFSSEGLNESPEVDDAGCVTAFTPDRDAGRPDEGHYAPAWCGGDRWSLTNATVIGDRLDPPTPLRTARGYVADYTLVLETNTDVQLPLGDVVGTMADVRLVARIVPLDPVTLEPAPGREPTGKDDRFFALEDGIIAGRFAARELLAAVGSMPAPNTNRQSPLCTDPLFEEAKKLFCPELDIAKAKERDGNLSFTCDAISAAFRFVGGPARNGELYTAPAFDNPCRLGPDDRPVDAGRDVRYTCP